MKRMIVALSLLCVVISAAFVTNFLAESAIDKSCQALEACTQKEKDESLDTLKIKEAVKTWDYNKKFILAIMFHDDFSEIENKMTELEYLSEFPDFDESAKISVETAMMLDKLREKFIVSFVNIV